MKPIYVLVIGLVMTVGMIAGLVALQGNQDKNIANLSVAVSADDHLLGEGPVTLVEYSDFQCPACGAYWPLLKQLQTDFPGKLILVYRHFPLRRIHPNADAAAQAAEAAGRQGKFWEMADLIFAGQAEWAKSGNAEEQFEKYAQQLGLDLVKFKDDADSSEIKQIIQQDLNEANAMNLSGTPSFFLNGQFIQGPGSYEAFKTLIAKQVGQ